MSEEEIENGSNLFDKIGQSQLFKPIVYQLISNVGYDIDISDEDKTLIEQNGFGNEIKSLLEDALTDKINDREVYMKGIDNSYLYEGYILFKTDEL